MSAFRSNFCLHEIIGGGGQQGLVAGGVRDPHVVDLLDQADAEIVGPDAVGDRAGEVGVLGRGQPFGEAHAAVGRVVEGERPAVERRRRLRLARPRLDQLARLGDVERAPAVAGAPLAAPALRPDPREQARHAVILVVGPFFERVVVALGAADRQAEERLSRRFRSCLRATG